MGGRSAYGPSYRFKVIPSSKEKSDWDKMSDSQKDVILKSQKQVGFVNVEDVGVTQVWFPIHLRSAGSVVGVGLVLLLLVCLFNLCRRKWCLRIKDYCLNCRRRDEAKERNDRVLEILARGAAIREGQEATTSIQHGRHHHHHHGGGRGHGRHSWAAQRGGHTQGRGYGRRHSPEDRHNERQHHWDEDHEEEMAVALEANLRTLAKMAIPSVQQQASGSRLNPSPEISEEETPVPK